MRFECQCKHSPGCIPFGLSKRPEYACWKSMRARCNRAQERSYKNYGARGIFVEKSWNESFLKFLSDMGPRPSSLHSLDRIDNDGPYSKENCRWALAREQFRNRRVSVLYEFNGKKMMLSEISEQIGIPAPTLWRRIKVMNLTLQEAVAFRILPRKKRSRTLVQAAS